ncbi:hypothetical protein RBU49_08385 [Clostridium sp. MB40-C1]|uniref:hypothetical protein n=1 Tax=Clostridium sp. MB40-C1 TaxID=3070996 RepID=UPI0027E12E19|nr:hypothetical protein [Clostridium sp. MB40-C1]WMJ82250.1 hypothetical protein RBU49_08385 [Clostridium sp. MB40-C1]
MSEVFQDNILLNDTIKNNIRLGNPLATEEEIIRSSKIAHAHEFIKLYSTNYKLIIFQHIYKYSIIC